MPHRILCRIDFVAVFNQPLPARPLLHLAHFGRAAHVLLFCLASRSRLIAPDLVHAVRWAKRVYDPVIVPSKPPPHRILPYLSTAAAASIFLPCILYLYVSCSWSPYLLLPTYVCTYLPIWRALGGSHFSKNVGIFEQYIVRVKLSLNWDPPAVSNRHQVNDTDDKYRTRMS